MPTISRRLASAGIADPGDLKSPSLPGASPGSPTGVWLIGNSRPVRLKIEQPWECKSPHADQFGMSTGRAGRTCLLNSGLPERGVWCESTAFRHSCARSSKRAGGLIPRIALDQCRVPERYRTRVPFRTPEREAAQAASLGRRKLFTLFLQLFYTRLTTCKVLEVFSSYRRSTMKLRNKGPLYVPFYLESDWFFGCPDRTHAAGRESGRLGCHSS